LRGEEDIPSATKYSCCFYLVIRDLEINEFTFAEYFYNERGKKGRKTAGSTWLSKDMYQQVALP
jgi:hypothetical protein